MADDLLVRLGMNSLVGTKRGLCAGALFCALVGCDSPSTCEDAGGVLVHGVCQCPLGKSEKGDRCVDDADASTPPDGATLPAISNDAGDSAIAVTASHGAPDASATDASAVDGSATASGEPDASRDGGVKCAPTGNFVTTYYERDGGSCGASIAPFTIALHGAIADSLKDEDDCQLTSQLSADGCTLSYEQLCPLPEPTKTWHEVGTVLMTSPSHIVGSAHVTVDDSTLSSKDMQCQSDVDIVVDAATM